MPVIVDASIQGKLKFPIMSNVLSDNDKMEFDRQSNRMINVTDQNIAKINRARGVPAIPAQVQSQAQGSKQGQAVAQDNTVSISESVKGQSLNATA